MVDESEKKLKIIHCGGIAFTIIDGLRTLKLTIDGTDYFPEEEVQKFSIPSGKIESLKISDIPAALNIEPYTLSEEGYHQRDLSGSLEIMPQKKCIQFWFDELYRGKFWREDFSMNKYIGLIKEAIEKFPMVQGEFVFDEICDNDDDYIFARFRFRSTHDDTIKTALDKVARAREELEKAILLLVNDISFSDENLNDEPLFTQYIIIPILRMMGMNEVQYYHGKREYGKDVTFSEDTKWGNKRYYGLQVKKGNISGATGSELETIISQLDDGFSMPFYVTSCQEKRNVHDMIVAISGHFTENAKEKIIEKVHQKVNGRRNILFLGLDEWKWLASKYVTQHTRNIVGVSDFENDVRNSLNRLESAIANISSEYNFG
ncbi:MAG: hypothetical protein HYV97_03700 [Bdellovibrio sp.]|nr:hypothetical protein [Bdellovibrio sp.]